jgi:arylsulfatase A-like enzyme|uniref:Sulfatase N-terminal domain-containing protein n=1 Tax=Desulfobacca acetoxidans TaxID=60893 RepID=A0A7C5ALQ7_9BACT
MMEKPPHIVLLVLDTVGAKHLSLYGYPRPTTPNLEKIAQECTVFTRCFAPACWTVPSHASMFTGLYPGQHGAYEKRYVLEENRPHLVSLLKASGYRTLGISANGAVSPATGLCRDFDEFLDLGKEDLNHLVGREQAEVSRSLKAGVAESLKQALTPAQAGRQALGHLKEPGNWRELLKTGLSVGATQVRKYLYPGPLDNATPYTKKTLRWLKRWLGQQKADSPPFFLFVNFFQAHHHYRPPLRWRRFSRWYHRSHVSPLRFYSRRPAPALTRLIARYTDLYDDEIFYLDSVLGKVWALLRESPGFADTVLIITSDHGEHLGEKGHYTHILSLYNELLWVPLLIRYPEKWKGAGQVDERLVSLTDLYATILDLVDSPFPRPETSVSLLGPPRRQAVVAQCLSPEIWRRPLVELEKSHQAQGQRFSPPVFAVITAEGTKVISKRDGSLEIYDLRGGIWEDRDLAKEISPGRLSHYRDLVESWKALTGFRKVEDRM